jgi:hypothetical protein
LEKVLLAVTKRNYQKIIHLPSGPEKKDRSPQVTEPPELKDL